MRSLILLPLCLALSTALPAVVCGHGSDVFEVDHNAASKETVAHAHHHASGEMADEFDELHEQIESLEKRLVARDEHARLTDIIGGIGYILGIAGIASYYLGGRRKRNAETSCPAKN